MLLEGLFLPVHLRLETREPVKQVITSPVVAGGVINC